MQAKIKTILGSVLFLSGLLVLLILASLLFRPKNNTTANGMEDMTANGILGEPEQTIDVLFLGDSVSYCSIIPVQIWQDYGITSYVCGTPLQKLYYSKEFLQKTFETQSPKLVLLEATPLFGTFEEKEAIKNNLERMLPIFRYHDRWKQLKTMLQTDKTLQVNYTYQNINKGYRYFATIEEIDAEDYAYETEKVMPIPEECRNAVKEIKAFCEEHGAELVLMSVPNASSWQPEKCNAAALFAQELGIEYFDMNYMQTEVPIDWSFDSFDAGEHLNYFGAKKVTAYLGGYLSKKNLFADKRGEEAYAFWNETQEKFYEMLE